MRETISIKLFNALQAGKKKLGKESLSRIKDFVGSQRLSDDGFMNKSGKSDIYYTLFGWMLSYVLGLRLDSKKTAAYLAEQDIDAMDLIHYAAYMRCRMIQRLLKGGKLNVLLHSFFSSPVRQLQDFSGLPHDDSEAPYTQFIWLSLLEDTGQTVKNKHDVLDSLALYRVPTGGYSNIPNGITAATNATAAGLVVTGQLNGYGKNVDVDYLWAAQHESGGFGATEDSPLPDVLSTATSLFALKAYDVQPQYSPVDFIEAHWLDSGGFSATLLEDTSDVEYTFYGLLALGTVE